MSGSTPTTVIFLLWFSIQEQQAQYTLLRVQKERIADWSLKGHDYSAITFPWAEKNIDEGG